MSKKFIHISLWILISPILGFGQDTDPILNRLSSITNREAKLELLDSICVEFKISAQMGGGIYFEKRAELLRAQLSFEEAVPRAKEEAFYYLSIGNQELAQDAVAYYVDRRSEITELSLKAKVSYTASFVEEISRNPELSLELMNESIAIHEILKDTMTIEYGESYKAQGRVLQSMGRFGEANLALTKAMDIFKAAKDTIGMAEVLNSKGIVFSMIGLYEESEDYYNEYLDLLSHPLAIDRAKNYANIGRGKLIQGLYTEALDLYEQALALSPYEHEFHNLEMYVLNGIIECSYHLGDLDRIPDVLEQLVEEDNRRGNQPGVKFLVDQSRFLKLLSEEKYTEAEVIGKALFKKSQELNDASEAMMHAQFLSDLYRKSGQYEKALFYTDLYAEAQDSTLTANKTNALILYQTQYETKEKELEIDRLALESDAEKSRSQRLLLIAGSLGILLTVGGYLYLKLRSVRAKLEIQNQELSTLNRTKNKFFGIIGHDISSPLLTIDAIGTRIKRQLAKKDYDKIEESTNMLSDGAQQLTRLLDNLLKWALSQNGVMPYQPEQIHVDKIIEENISYFQEAASAKGVDLSFNIPTDLSLSADRNAINGTCRNLISNALKFTASGGAVQILAKKINSEIHIEFRDTGSGMSADQLASIQDNEMMSTAGTAGEAGTGLGLVLIKELVQLNKGRLKSIVS